MSIRSVGTSSQENSVSEKTEGRHGLIDWGGGGGIGSGCCGRIEAAARLPEINKD
jgi:hypothetical protein